MRCRDLRMRLIVHRVFDTAGVTSLQRSAASGCFQMTFRRTPRQRGGSSHDTNLCGCLGRNLRNGFNRLGAGVHVVRFARLRDVLRTEPFVLGVQLSRRLGSARPDQLATAGRVVQLFGRLYGGLCTVELLRTRHDELLRSACRHIGGLLLGSSHAGVERLLHAVLYPLLLPGLQRWELSGRKLCNELRSVGHVTAA